MHPSGVVGWQSRVLAFAVVGDNKLWPVRGQPVVTIGQLSDNYLKLSETIGNYRQLSATTELSDTFVLQVYRLCIAHTLTYVCDCL